jgi:hypothetical protein
VEPWGVPVFSDIFPREGQTCGRGLFEMENQNNFPKTR